MNASWVSASPMLHLSPGGALMGFVYPFNLREIGNGVALWLGIEPYELFFYIFLPPLLLDAALKIDWYIFKKVGADSRAPIESVARRAPSPAKLRGSYRRHQAALRIVQTWRARCARHECRIMSQVALNVVTLAFLVVASTCAVLIPVMLYIFWLKPSGWQWYDAALFGSIIASTDAVAIVAVLKKSARPTLCRPPASHLVVPD